jgi:hypothetical protein
MGKAISFLLASLDLTVLALLAAPGHRTVWGDLGLFWAFAVVALLAWAVALLTALGRALSGHGWRPVAALLALLWLPALPPLVYGASGVRDLFARDRGRAHRRVARTVVNAPTPLTTRGGRPRPRVAA